MFSTRVLPFLISICSVFNEEVVFSLETIDIGDLEVSDCQKSFCMLEINNTTDQLIRKIQDLEQQNEEALRKISQVDEEAQRKITEVNNKTDRLLAKIESIGTKNDQRNKQNRYLREELTRLQDVVSKVKEKTASQEACFEDITEPGCSGSKSGKVGIVEAIRVDGGWGSWSSWSRCSAKCKWGVQVRRRTCNNPAPLFGGKPCLGGWVEEQECQGSQVCCEDGWTPFGNHCYTFLETRMTWTHAEEYCRTNYQANLASITSHQENRFVFNLSQRQSSWIGGTDGAREGTWVWTDGTPWEYTLWYMGNPNNKGGIEHYVYITRIEKWNDTHKDSKFPFICKLPAVNNGRKGDK